MSLSDYRIRAQQRKEKEQLELGEAQKVKLKRQLKQGKEERKKRERVQAILQPNIKNNLLEWRTKSPNAYRLEGYFKGKLIFEIKRGLISFSLNIIHDGCKKEYIKRHSSTEIFKLQEKANKILTELVLLLEIS